ncbi:MAG: hypothetical protein AAF721_13405 [Myxococcota bacterium]
MTLPLTAEERMHCPRVDQIGVYLPGDEPPAPYERVAELQSVGIVGAPPEQVGAWLRHRAGDVCADAIVEAAVFPRTSVGSDEVSFIGRAIAIRFMEPEEA